MNWRKIATSLAALALMVPAGAGAQAQDAELRALDDVLPGSLVNDPRRMDWFTQGKDLKVRTVRGDDIPGGGAAVQFAVRKADPQVWSAQAHVPLTADVKKGEAMTIGLWARTVEAQTEDGTGKLFVRFQQTADPWPGFGEKTLSIGPEWNWYEVSGVATFDIKHKDVVVTLQFGDVQQTLQVGQAIIVSGASSIAGG